MVEQRAVCFEWCAVVVEAAEDTIFVVVEYSIKGVEVDVIEVRWDNLVATAVDNTAAVVGLDDSAIFKEVSSPFIACGDYLPAASRNGGVPRNSRGSYLYGCQQG